MRRPLVPLALILGLWIAACAPAFGHSVVERSSPAPNAALDAPPGQIELWFNEPVDPAFSSVTVTDPAGALVSERAAVSEDGRRVTAPLRQIPKGFYTVRWRVLSSVDGHATSGVFAFTVGLGARPPEGFGGTQGPDLAAAAIRWVGLAAALLVAGASLFGPRILAPALREVEPVGAGALHERAARPIRVVTAAGCGVVIGAAALEVVVGAASLTGATLGQVAASGLLAQMVWGTKPGWSALVRAVAAALLLLPRTASGRILQAAGLAWLVLVGGVFTLLGGPSGLAGSTHLALLVLVGAVYGLASVMAAIILPQIRDLRLPDLAIVPPLVAAIMLFGLTVNSHAWGSGPLAAVVDWAHLLANASWLGGLACLVLIVLASRGDDRKRLASVLLPRFSRLAAICLGVVVTTGLYGIWLHMPGLRALALTQYGRFLSAKLVFVVPLVALGAVNRFVVRRRLQAVPVRGGVMSDDGAAAGAAQFLRLAGAEVGVAAVVLFVAALLAATPPARVVLATRPAPSALRYLGSAGEARIELVVAPAQPGPNQVDVTVARTGGEPSSGESRVLARLIKLDEDVTPTTLTLLAAGGGRDTARRVTLPPGWWEIEVILRRRGQLDLVTSFPLRLVPAQQVATDPAALRLLEGAGEAMAALRAWREVEQITDGAGGLLIASVDLLPPDRMYVRTSSGAEVVFIGPSRYLREGAAPWRHDELARPVAVEGVLQYLRGARSVRLGRRGPCGEEPCRVVLWDAPDGAAAFAGWIGEATRRIHKVLMVAPRHYMTARVGDFNAAIRIERPR
ncbi:MAG: copper resistance protein CopC [Armatimonadota bacterium]|nr:copper resistance protein CopC [Armatimonadota bacterium]